MHRSKILGSTTVRDAWRFLSQRQITRDLTQDHNSVFRKHLTRPDPEKVAANYNKRFRLYWKNRSDKLVPRHAVSETQQWLTAVGATVNVIPRDLSQVEFAASEIAPIPRPPGPTPKRTEEHRRRSEAVLSLSISPLANYVSPQMSDSIRKSPHYVPDKKAIEIRCHQHQKQAANQRECFKKVNRFIRNVANEIVYRENIIAAEEVVYKGEGDNDKLQ